MKTFLTLLLLVLAFLAFPATPVAAAPECEVDAFQGDCRFSAVCWFRHAYNSWIDWSHTTVDCARVDCRADFDSTVQDRIDCMGHHYQGHTPLSTAPLLALPAGCTTDGGDTDCRASYGGCDVHTHTYDVEDHPNVYSADCWDCGATVGAGVTLHDRCYTPPPIATANPALSPPALPTAAALPCTLGPTTPGGDTHCQGTVGGCSFLVHMYDMEDALNHYKVGCGCVAYDNYGRPALRLCNLVAPTGAAAAVPSLPFETHCVADDTGAAHCTTVVAGTCSYTTVSDGSSPSTLACWSTAFGYCSITPGQDPPNLWCENIQPGDDSSAQVAPPALPCQTGIAGTDCGVGALSCSAHVGYRTGSDSYQYARTYCGPPTWSPCEHIYVDTDGNVRSCLVAMASATTATEVPPEVCTDGDFQTWCDVTAGPCDVRVTPWTVWGDQWARADCRGGGAGPTCHTEVHTEDLTNPEHWCAF